MLLDTVKVRLSNGTEMAAIDVLTGRRLVTPGGRRSTRIKDRQIRMSTSVLGLMLSNGRVLVGSWDQKIWCLKKLRYYRQMTDIEIGDRLIGLENGVSTVVIVTGISCMTDIERRLVRFETKAPFVAEGVVCRF